MVSRFQGRAAETNLPAHGKLKAEQGKPMAFEYNIETDGSFSARNANENDIERAFERDRERGEFIILDRSDGSFLQAAGTGSGPYVLEHMDGQTKEHSRAVEELGKDQVRLIFLQFYRGEPTWRSSRRWEPVKTGGGCLAILALGGLLLGLRYAGLAR